MTFKYIWDVISGQTRSELADASFSTSQTTAKLVQMYTARANSWLLMANVSFFMAVLGVAAGIGLFVFAPTFTISNELPELIAKRDALQVQYDNALKGASTASKEAVHYPRVLDSFEKVSVFLTRLEASFDETEGKLRDGASTTIKGWRREVSAISESLQTLKAYEPGAKEEFFKNASDNKVRTAIQRSGLDTATVLRLGHELIELLKSIDQESFTDFDVAALASLDSGTREVRGQLDALVADVKRIVAEVENAQQDSIGSDILYNFERQIADQTERINEVRFSVSANNLYSVIPLVVVRVGAVILLIFLTQIFLASYRYNTMLATYYDSIADALRLATERADVAQPDRREFLILLEKVHLASAAFVPPESPTKDLVALTRPT